MRLTHPGRISSSVSDCNARDGHSGVRRSQRLTVRQNRVKILLDRCLPIDLRLSFPTHVAHTLQWAGLKGKQNGYLLDAAELTGYQVLLTMDQGVEHQQNLPNRRIALLVRVVTSNQLEDLRPLVLEALIALETIERGTIVRVGTSSAS
jgi:hypothetical protein